MDNGIVRSPTYERLLYYNLVILTLILILIVIQILNASLVIIMPYPEFG